LLAIFPQGATDEKGANRTCVEQEAKREPMNFGGNINTLTGVYAADAAAASSPFGAKGDLPRSSSRIDLGTVLVALGFLALVGTELVLVFAIPGVNYAGADGKAAQAIILATLEFARPFHISNLNPLEGMGSQMMPMNVWVNPAYWPFAFFSKHVAADVSGLVAFVCYALACYAMARCFDVPRLPSIAAAQLSLMLFGPAALAVVFAIAYVSIPGLAVVYAPHVLAFGLLARLSPARPHVFLMGTALTALLFYSLYCDPLWTLVSGIAWIVPFAVVTFSPMRRDTILIRCAVLGACVGLLLLSGALEYAYSLSQYTARVQFPDLLRRPPDAVFASAVVSSKYAQYFYCTCVPGWALGMALLRGRPRTLVLAAIISAVALLVYAAAFLYLGRNWPLPLPHYLEHALFPLFWTAAVAGYWGGLEALVTRGLFPLPASWGLRDACVAGWLSREKGRALAISFTPHPNPLPASEEREPAESGAPLGSNLIGNRVGRWWPRVPALSSRQAAAAITLMALAAVCILPALTIDRVVKFPKSTMRFWQEPWLDQPELDQFFASSIGLRDDRRFRGTALFYTNQYDEFLTMDSLWAAGVPTANEYSQLVTPQSIYFINQLFGRDLTYELNWFHPWSGDGDFPLLFKTLRAMGVRYVVGYERFAGAEAARLRSIALPRRPISGGPGDWLVYELPDLNMGNYSPTSIMIAEVAAEILGRLRAPNFDYSSQVALSAPIERSLLPARDVRMSIVQGGLHVSAQSEGTSLLLLPYQFSHCLRAHDDAVQLVRADLLMTGMVFSGRVDTDISFDYGILSPQCRRADFTDIKQLQFKLASP
jgi:hypothetical protein